MKNENKSVISYKRFEFLEHPADIKIRAHGKDMPEVFVNAALGMMQYLFGAPKVKVDKIEHLEVIANDLESLLVNWLSDLLALSAINKCVYVAFTFSEFNQNKIVASIGSGKAISKEEIKAVTYHELQIVQQNDEWMATVVFDI